MEFSGVTAPKSDLRMAWLAAMLMVPESAQEPQNFFPWVTNFPLRPVALPVEVGAVVEVVVVVGVEVVVVTGVEVVVVTGVEVVVVTGVEVVVVAGVEVVVVGVVEVVADDG
jgi:hypothetical protein